MAQLFEFTIQPLPANHAQGWVRVAHTVSSSLGTRGAPLEPEQYQCVMAKLAELYQQALPSLNVAEAARLGREAMEQLAQIPAERGSQKAVRDETRRLARAQRAVMAAATQKPSMRTRSGGRGRPEDVWKRSMYQGVERALRDAGFECSREARDTIFRALAASVGAPIVGDLREVRHPLRLRRRLL